MLFSYVQTHLNREILVPVRGGVDEKLLEKSANPLAQLVYDGKIWLWLIAACWASC